MKVKGIQLSWIVVKDLQKAIKFYTDIVGLKLLNQSPEYGWAELAGPGGCTLGIAQENPQMDNKYVAGTNAIMTVSVEDIDKALAVYKKKGVRLIGDVVEVPGHVKMQTFSDQDGNLMQVVQTLDH